MNSFRMKSVSPVVIVVCLFAWASDAIALCNQTFVNGHCTSCRNWPGSPAWNGDIWGGCAPCGGWCISFSPSKSESADIDEAIFVPVAAAGRSAFSASDFQIREIGDRNPWASYAMVVLRTLGDAADLRSGTIVLGSLPTSAAIDALSRGNGSVLKAQPIPEGVLARVSYRTERFADGTVTIHLSSFVADSDERVLYLAFPNVVLTATEISMAAPITSLAKAGDNEPAARSLSVVSWRIAE